MLDYRSNVFYAVSNCSNSRKNWAEYWRIYKYSLFLILFLMRLFNRHTLDKYASNDDRDFRRYKCTA